MNKYPIGGFAPGNYMNNCLTCDSKFIGDKGAWQCESCATKASKPTTDNKAVFDCIVAKTMFGSAVIISGKRNLEESTAGFYDEPLEVLLDGVFLEDNGITSDLFSDKEVGVYSCKMILTVSGGYAPGEITEYSVSLGVCEIVNCFLVKSEKITPVLDGTEAIDGQPIDKYLEDLTKEKVTPIDDNISSFNGIRVGDRIYDSRYDQIGIVYLVNELAIQVAFPRNITFQPGRLKYCRSYESQHFVTDSRIEKVSDTEVFLDIVTGEVVG